MSDRNEGVLIGLFFGAILAFMVYSATIKTMRALAVKNNVGEWVVTDKFGGTEFRWKPCDRQ